VRELAHALKGVSGSLGMSLILERASKIELDSKDKNTDLVQEQISLIAIATNEAVKAIHAQIES